MVTTGEPDGWGQCHTVGRGCGPDQVFGAVSGFGTKCATKHDRSSERALPPMTKTPLTALSARSNSLDDIDGGPERGVYTQMRRIEQVRVRRCFERGRGAPRISFIATQEVG
jgi:hypothetical protein